MFCLEVPLTKVPRGNWFCPKCTQARNKNDYEKGTASDLIERIKSCLDDLGGNASGLEITNWISEHYNVPLSDRKTLSYRVNALLSAKTHLFQKTSVLIEGTHRASVWNYLQYKNSESGNIDTNNNKFITSSNETSPKFIENSKSTTQDEKDEKFKVHKKKVNLHF